MIGRPRTDSPAAPCSSDQPMEPVLLTLSARLRAQFVSSFIFLFRLTLRYAAGHAGAVLRHRKLRRAGAEVSVLARCRHYRALYCSKSARLVIYF